MSKQFKIYKPEDEYKIIAEVYPDTHELIKQLLPEELEVLVSKCNFYISDKYGFTQEERERIIHVIRNMPVPFTTIIKATKYEFGQEYDTVTI